MTNWMCFNDATVGRYLHAVYRPLIPPSLIPYHIVSMWCYTVLGTFFFSSVRQWLTDNLEFFDALSSFIYNLSNYNFKKLFIWIAHCTVQLQRNTYGAPMYFR